MQLKLDSMAKSWNVTKTKLLFDKKTNNYAKVATLVWLLTVNEDK